VLNETISRNPSLRYNIFDLRMILTKISKIDMTDMMVFK